MIWKRPASGNIPHRPSEAPSEVVRGPRARLAGVPQIISIHVNRMVMCGYCHGTYQSSDGTDPHDVEACRVSLGMPLPEPNPVISAGAR